MDKRHRDVLRQKRVYLTENLDPDVLINHLVEENLLSEDAEEEIRGERRRAEKTRKIIAAIQLRGPTAFDRFIKCLNAAGQDFIAEELVGAAKGTQRLYPPDTSTMNSPPYFLGSILINAHRRNFT